MSRENVDVVGQVYEAVGRGDREAVLALYDPVVELDFTRSPFVSVFNRSVYRGHEGIRAFFREREEEAWRYVVDSLDELIDAGDQVVCVVTSQGRGRASGAEVRRTHAGVWTIRNGRIVRVVWLPTREDALEAAGVQD
jgi:ketosteroid isomerase-like protein